MREPDAHPVGAIGAVKYEDAMGHVPSRYKILIPGMTGPVFFRIDVLTEWGRIISFIQSYLRSPGGQIDPGLLRVANVTLG
jgi:hypothetical protein